MKRREVVGESLRFVLVGTAATALHYATYWLLRACVPLSVAYTLGYAVSFVANFYITAWFTFRQSPSWRRAVGFSGAHLTNYLLHMGCFNLFLWLGVPPPWAPLPVFAVVVPINYLLVRTVFKKM